ncbi:hypothetical protein SNEBB_001658 [Seison nebaliae]|nr:hypothetical protein SNEBB_001658 [Seison nebaliae]
MKSTPNGTGVNKPKSFAHAQSTMTRIYCDEYVPLQYPKRNMEDRYCANINEQIHLLEMENSELKDRMLTNHNHLDVIDKQNWLTKIKSEVEHLQAELHNKTRKIEELTKEVKELRCERNEEKRLRQKPANVEPIKERTLLIEELARLRKDNVLARMAEQSKESKYNCLVEKMSAIQNMMKEKEDCLMEKNAEICEKEQLNVALNAKAMCLEKDMLETKKRLNQLIMNNEIQQKCEGVKIKELEEDLANAKNVIKCQNDEVEDERNFRLKMSQEYEKCMDEKKKLDDKIVALTNELIIKDGEMDKFKEEQQSILKGAFSETDEMIDLSNKLLSNLEEKEKIVEDLRTQLKQAQTVQTDTIQVAGNVTRDIGNIYDYIEHLEKEIMTKNDFVSSEIDLLNKQIKSKNVELGDFRKILVDLEFKLQMISSLFALQSTLTPSAKTNH